MLIAIVRSIVFLTLMGASAAWAQNVKITPLGSHAGELCARDRATIFEDPSGVRILYDAGQSVTGGEDPRLGKIVIASRYDEVREVYLNDPAFRVPYAEKLDVLMQNKPFFLGMSDTAEYRADTAAMREVVLRSGIPARLVPAVEQLGEQIVAGAGGRLEVVDALVRKITFDVYRDYFGVTDPPGGDSVDKGSMVKVQFVNPFAPRR